MRKLGRPSGHRKTMLKNLTTDLLKYGRIETTEARAREVRRVTEKIITLAKKDDLASRRLVLKQVLDETTVKNLFENIAPKYKDRNGGYVRIIKSAPRRGDATPTAIVELV